MIRILLIVTGTIAALGITNCNKATGGTPDVAASTPAKPPLAVETIIAEPMPITRQIKASGIIKGITEVTIVSQTQGTIKSVGLKLGSYVSKGTSLVSIDDVLLQALLEQAQSQFAVAELSFNATKKLFEENNASAMELALAQNQLHGASAMVKQAQQSVDNSRIVAPISGSIVYCDQSLATGGVLSPGMPVARIADISRFILTVDIGENDITLIKKGTPALVVIPSSGITINGSVTAIAAGSTPATGSFTIEIVFSNTKEATLLSGMSAYATILSTANDSLITIPVAALVRRNEQDALFVSVNGRAQLRFVKIAQRSDAVCSIKEGLQSGMDIVISGISSITPGDSLTLTARKTNKDL